MTAQRHFPGVQMLQWTIGAVSVTSVTELDDPAIPGTAVIPAATPEAILDVGWLRPRFADDAGNIRLRIQALVVESEGRRIVVDTCLGNDKPRNNPFFANLQTPFLDDLTAAGFAPGSVDAVVCTHLHVDHIGWNTVLRGDEWVPTFPHARYYMSRVDVQHWSTTPSADGDLFGDSVRPVLDAGQAELVDPPFALTGEVTLEPTPGHSPGHMSVRIRSGGREAVITGDVMHHPVQCAQPSWSSTFDSDAAAAEATRRAFLAAHADRDILVLGTHFAAPVGGYVTRVGDVFGFEDEFAG
jgi:glyoxylase-like metal-dependent hydrolase (beta-lactamase superfamily II)